ncbi:MAG: tetratricopeptide repeat protein [Anaerolineales bacterium]|nr:tetratricopeptide repeat protein [Anaerolineales bacterium]
MVSPHGNEDAFRRAMNLGHSAAWEGRWQEAVEHYGHALQEFPDNPPTLNSLALAHYELGNLEQALEFYRRASRLAPEDPLPIEKMAEIFKTTGRKDEAIQFSMRAAELYLSLRDADKAINNWTRVVRLEPENLDAHSRLALVYERLGRIPQAITEYIAVAALQQHAGEIEEARASGEHALRLNPKSKEAQQAVAMLKAYKTLPKPLRMGAATGPLRLPPGAARPSSLHPSLHAFDEGPDPVEEANQHALQALAAMLFDLTPVEPEKRKGGLGELARTVTDGILARGFDERAIARHLSQALEFETRQDDKHTAEQLKAAIDAGLDHPAAHFNLGTLLEAHGRAESAQRHFQKALEHPDYALASHLLIGDYLRQQDKTEDAVREYLQALALADAAVVPAEQAPALRAAYASLLEKSAGQENRQALSLLGDNIRYLLMRPNWRTGVNEARGQLPVRVNASAPTPVAEILTHANSARLVDALGRINQISRQGHLRAAMEEAYAALEFSPSYLPLHVHMAELLLLSDRPQQATEKLATVARVYRARGDNERATQTYQRIVAISPLDVDARLRLIEQLSASDQLPQAASQNLELADVYYRLAQLDKARDTYEKALRLAQGAEVDAAWNVQVLHQMADIDLQRLDWRKALLVYEQIRSLAPDDETARLNLVQLNLRLGQEGKANGELENYLSYLNSRGRDEEAGSFLSTLVDENPRFTLGQRRLAEHYQQMGKRGDAIRTWNKVGELLVEAGDREGAKIAVRAILALNPPNPERYQQFLQRLSK